nr:prepilin-type N-terminal cleavage/methylation domain-containing protein [Xanthomonas phaseoli]
MSAGFTLIELMIVVAVVIPPLLAVARSGAKRPSPTSWQA